MSAEKKTLKVCAYDTVVPGSCRLHKRGNCPRAHADQPELMASATVLTKAAAVAIISRQKAKQAESNVDRLEAKVARLEEGLEKARVAATAAAEKKKRKEERARTKPKNDNSEFARAFSFVSRLHSDAFRNDPELESFFESIRAKLESM
jgi:outer membrane murein-binding lipoprotein Lpp